MMTGIYLAHGPSMRPSWESVWMKTADAIAERSRCDRARVGAVIVSEHNNVLAAAYNGPPHSWCESAGTDSRCPTWCTRGSRAPGEPVDDGYADCPAAHAEMNALARLDASQSAGSTLYVTTGCCFHCAKVIANTQIVRVVARWADRADAGHVAEFLAECGLEVITCF